MEDVIIGLLFLYVFVLRPILKQVRKGADAGRKPGPPRPALQAWLEKLRARLREVSAQVESGRRGQAGRRPDPVLSESFVPEPTSPLEPEGEEPVASAPLPASAMPPTDPVLPPRPRVDLRQAVVWAEILGPPVSLRDQG